MSQRSELENLLANFQRLKAQQQYSSRLQDLLNQLGGQQANINRPPVGRWSSIAQMNADLAKLPKKPKVSKAERIK